MSILLLQETLTRLYQLFPHNLLLVAVFLIIVCQWFSTSTNLKSSSPPCPPKLPLIGNLHQIGLPAHRSLGTLSQRYGPLMLLHFGSMPVLVVSSADAACEVMKTHDLAFSSKPKIAFFQKVFYGQKDVATAPYGEYWKKVRSICVLNLLSTKMVRSFRHVREEETKFMISNITKHSTSTTSSVLNLSKMLQTLTNDVICRAAFGRKYGGGGGDQGEGGFGELSVELTELMGRVNIGDYIPCLAWFTRLSGWDAELDSLARRLDHFLQMVVEDHKDDFLTKSEEQMDFVDILLSVQKQNAADFSIDLVGIKGIILDIFAAGTDTTSTALEWTMSELLRNPEVMKKLQKEVRGIVGNKTEITEEDLLGMHYLKAVIKESFRVHLPKPLLMPRMSTQDVNINGYNIKSGTQVIVNAWKIGRDPKSYDDPEAFKPERFLNSAVDFKGNDFELIPFGAGRRGCAGIQFAMAIKEIALAHLVQKFDWELPGGARAEDLDMTESTGATTHRQFPLQVVAIPYL